MGTRYKRLLCDTFVAQRNKEHFMISGIIMTRGNMYDFIRPLLRSGYAILQWK
jgi:hypothetical protein